MPDNDAELQALVDDFFEKVSQHNPCEVIRLLEFFQSPGWMASEQRHAALKRLPKSPDSLTVRPPETAERTLATAAGKP